MCRSHTSGLCRCYASATQVVRCLYFTLSMASLALVPAYCLHCTSAASVRVKPAHVNPARVMPVLVLPYFPCTVFVLSVGDLSSPKTVIV